MKKHILTAAICLTTIFSAHAGTFEPVQLKPALLSGFFSEPIGKEKSGTQMSPTLPRLAMTAAGPMVAAAPASSQPYRANNTGIGFRDKSGILFGYFKNSLDKDSVYIGYEHRTHLHQYLQLGWIVGVVTGLKADPSLMMVPELVVPIDNLEIAAMYFPSVGKTQAAGALQVRWTWN